MRSMTGFGQAQHSNQEMDLSVEIKTVNSRYLDLHLHLPRELSSLEPELRKEAQSSLSRGRVEIHLAIDLKSNHHYDLNEALVENYLSAAKKVQSLGAKGGLDVSAILQLPGVVAPRQMDFSADGLMESTVEAFREGLENVVSARSSEGAALKKDLEDRLEHLAELTRGIAAEAEHIPDYYQKKLKQRIQNLTQEKHVDEHRLAQEILHYAERADIAEEITRLKSHISRFQEELSASEDKAVGRRLDFLSQEMGREMNTVLSKSPMTIISDFAVEGKMEIEKIREQVQNVE